MYFGVYNENGWFEISKCDKNYLRSCEVLFNGGEQNFVLGKKHRLPQNFRGWLEMITHNRSGGWDGYYFFTLTLEKSLHQ